VASLSDARLKITKDRDADTVTATTSVRVNFDDYDKTQMALGLKYRVDLSLWGNDPIDWYPGSSIFDQNDDDQLWPTEDGKYISQIITDPSKDVVSRRFTFAQGGILNEDPGKDTIYVKFELWNLFSNTAVAELWSNMEKWGHF
jgi:hypothetical protein